MNIPNYATLIEATFTALKMLGGSGKNDEINLKVAEILHLYHCPTYQVNRLWNINMIG